MLNMIKGLLIMALVSAVAILGMLTILATAQYLGGCGFELMPSDNCDFGSTFYGMLYLTGISIAVVAVFVVLRTASEIGEKF